MIWLYDCIIVWNWCLLDYVPFFFSCTWVFRQQSELWVNSDLFFFQELLWNMLLYGFNSLAIILCKRKNRKSGRLMLRVFYFKPFHTIYTLWKLESPWFFMFLRSIEGDQWHEIGQPKKWNCKPIFGKKIYWTIFCALGFFKKNVFEGLTFSQT